MRQRPRPADWNLPAGVAPGTWDYVQSAHIATEYDAFLANTPLTSFDLQVVRELLPKASSSGGLIADLGCGTGRTLPIIQELGYRMLGIDLSQNMLNELRKRVGVESSNQPEPLLVRANLVQLDGLQNSCIDHALCLFSTLGMIRGHGNRATVLKHVYRMLKPGGMFIVHVHNLRAALRDPGGLRFLFSSYRRSRRQSEYDFGDRVYGYRGLPNMFLHSFRPRELRSLITRAGFRIAKWQCLTIQGGAVLPADAVFANWRAGGFIILCQRPARVDVSSPRLEVDE